MRGRFHSREFKLEVVPQHPQVGTREGEKRPAQVCREHGRAEGLLLRWRKEHTERGVMAFTAARASASWSCCAVRWRNWSVSVGNSPSK
jgi:transposase